MSDPNPSVEDVLKTSDMAFQEYQHATQRFAIDAEVLLILPTLSLAISSVKRHLESALDDEEVSERVKGIFLDQTRFLAALNGDLSFLCSYLQGIGTGQRPSRHEVDTYAQALDHYSDVLKVVQKRDLKYVIGLPADWSACSSLTQSLEIA
jgi:hypothetical protein